MSVMHKISGYFKQLAGEVSGSQALHDEGRREAGYQEKDEQVVPVVPVAGSGDVVSAQTGRRTTVEADAAPQFAVSQAGSTNDGVVSAKPRVITGSDDATMRRRIARRPERVGRMRIGRPASTKTHRGRIGKHRLRIIPMSSS
ncbi:hypothetical protein [Shinella oryzae]|uniref:hypothetical protein n=1 Tax=Shinella oryzae TaxID=2871820 RepID=UPI0031BB65F0